jgi:hypothetical protein
VSRVQALEGETLLEVADAQERRIFVRVEGTPEVAPDDWVKVSGTLSQARSQPDRLRHRHGGVGGLDPRAAAADLWAGSPAAASTPPVAGARRLTLPSARWFDRDGIITRGAGPGRSGVDDSGFACGRT